MKQILAAILAIAILSAMVLPVSAAVPEETVASPRYSYIQSASVNLIINDETGMATCTSSCYASSEYVVYIDCMLQRYSGSSWTTLRTWIKSAKRYASIEETWKVYSGYTYRVYSTFRIYNASGTLLETGTNSKSVVFT